MGETCRLYKKARRVRNWLFLRRAYEKAAAENPALERIFAQERDQANVQMTLNAKNYTLASEPKSNLYGPFIPYWPRMIPASARACATSAAALAAHFLPDAGQSRELFFWTTGQAAQAV